MKESSRVIKICIVGAESTGKTTLTRNLAEHFQTVWVPEYGRIFAEGKVFLPTYSTWHTNEFTQIARAQTELINALLPNAKKYLFIDTDAFATSIWHTRYMEYESEMVNTLAAQAMCDVYLLTSPDVPFIQDGTRDGEKVRDWMHEEFRKKLDKLGRQFFVISGPYENRFDQALQYIQKIV